MNTDDTQDMSDLIGQDAENLIDNPLGTDDPSAPPMPALQGNPQAPNIGTVAPTMPDPQSPGSPEEQQADADSSAPVPRGGSGSLWENILMGALSGLAGQQQKGRSSVANGIIGGAKGIEAAQQQQVENSNQSAELQMKQQQLSSEDQMRQAQVANALVQHQILAKQFSDLTEPAQQKAIEQESAAAEAQDTTFGNPPVATFKNTHDAYDAATKDTQAAAQAGNHFDRYIVLHRSDGTAGEYKMSNGTNTQPYTMKGADGSDINIPTGSMTAEQDVSARIGIAKNNADNDLKAQAAQAKEDAAKARQEASDAKGGNVPVYAIDKNGATQYTTMANATAQGMVGARPVKQTDIRADQHDIKVLNDLQIKSDNVNATASALDQSSWAQTPLLAKYLSEHPNSTTQGLLQSDVLKNMTPQTKAYALNVMSLRETAMGLNKLLTGSARSNDAQIKALQATLPGVEPDAATVKQKMANFTQNLGMLSEGLPNGTGVAIRVRPSQPASAPVQVTDPKGTVHTFPDQKSADNFKKAAGIQ